jgi:hypothetical protein
MKPNIKIHDCTNNTVIVREMNDFEYEQYQIDVANKQETTPVQS